MERANATAQSASGPVLSLRRPPRQRVALVLSSPHSGRAYPAAFLAASRLDALELRRSEDAFVDELIAFAAALGAPALAALFPRAWLDANRAPYELDPAMFDAPLPAWIDSRSPRVAAGLGTLARVVAGGAEIYRRRLSPGEAKERIARCWRPYHAALAGLVAETRQSFGHACLIDCHSMPSRQGDGTRQLADAVVGDRFGTSCHPAIAAAACDALAACGLAVARNHPYPGGFITAHYGRPAEGVHALQIELNRALYMDEAKIARGPGMAATRRALERAARAVAAVIPALPAPPQAAAAE